MEKPILVNTTSMDLGDNTLLCMRLWTLCRRSTVFDAVLRASCPIVKALVPNHTSSETPVNSTHPCFPPTDMYTITCACLSVELPCRRSNKKLTSTCFFTDIFSPPEYIKDDIIMKSCLYLKLEAPYNEQHVPQRYPGMSYIK